MKRINNTIIIGVDHGFGNIKHASGSFRAGLIEYDDKPTVTTNLLTYENKYYLIGEGHKEFTADKFLDPDYYIADEDDLIDAVIRSYGDLYITREMVYIVNRAPVAQGIYVVSYTIEVEPYHDCGDYAVGHYTLTVTDDSMPVIYSVGDREICSFAEAWEKGLIANRRICRNIEALEWVSFSKNLLIGDVDDDDRITVLDATMIPRGLSGLLGEDYRFSACADADGDGMVTILDATRIQRYKAQLCSLDGTVPYGAQEESA